MVMRSPCPVCQGELADGDLILVCGDCRDRLGGGVSVRATGEFRVPADLVGYADTGGGMSADSTPGAPTMCTWCAKSAGSVRKLLGTAAFAICDECVSLCADILEAELGPDWR
jgi:hypothetical protein